MIKSQIKINGDTLRILIAVIQLLLDNKVVQVKEITELSVTYSKYWKCAHRKGYFAKNKLEGFGRVPPPTIPSVMVTVMAMLL